jgi:hypothetical protein
MDKKETRSSGTTIRKKEKDKEEICPNRNKQQGSRRILAEIGSTESR